MMYEVVVSNVGLVYRGRDNRIALDVYNEYCALSKQQTGICAGSTVTFYRDDIAVSTYEGHS